MPQDLRVFIGRANPPLGAQICDALEVTPGRIDISEFADGEIFVQIHENVRESQVFVVQPTSPPGNSNIMELLIIVDALKRASARRITAVIPYFGYARQDRRDNSRVPITAKLVADLLYTAGVQRVLTLDLHAGQIQGFFNIPVDHLYASPVLVNHLRTLEIPDAVIVSPDAGGVERARAFAKPLGANLAIIDKRRDKEMKNQVTVFNVIGEVKDKNCIIVDDMIDTAGTLIEAAKCLISHGAAKVYAVATHGVFSGPAFERIANSCLERVIVTNSIAHKLPPEVENRIHVIKIGSFMAEAMQRICTGESVSEMISFS